MFLNLFVFVLTTTVVDAAMCQACHSTMFGSSAALAAGPLRHYGMSLPENNEKDQETILFGTCRSRKNRNVNNSVAIQPTQQHHHSTASAMAMTLFLSTVYQDPLFRQLVVLMSGDKVENEKETTSDEESDNDDQPKRRTLEDIIMNDDEKQQQEEDTSDDDKPLTDSMVFCIGIYKKYVSPVLPPACRFLPTCSQYGVQAIQEFGPTKGCILTAWRLLRCSPIGGKGYDPPRWPPVFYTYSSY